MSRRIVGLLGVALTLLPSAATGQTAASEALIQQVGAPGATDAQTLGVLTGLGFDPGTAPDLVSPLIAAALSGGLAAGNHAVIDQWGEGHRAAIHQRGTNLVAGVAQEGARQVADILQEGSGHLVGLWLEGTDNAVQVTQRGADNRYFLDFRGDALRHTVVQQGIGLRAIQLGRVAQPFGIVQRGTDLEIRIEHHDGNHE